MRIVPGIYYAHVPGIAGVAYRIIATFPYVERLHLQYPTLVQKAVKGGKVQPNVLTEYVPRLFRAINSIDHRWHAGQIYS